LNPHFFVVLCELYFPVGWDPLPAFKANSAPATRRAAMFTSRSGTQPTRAFMQLPVSMSRRPAFLLQRPPLPCRSAVALIVLRSVSGCFYRALDAPRPVGAADA